MRRRTWLGLALALLLAVCVAVLPSCSEVIDEGWLESLTSEDATLVEDEASAEDEGDDPAAVEAPTEDEGDPESGAEQADKGDDLAGDPADDDVGGEEGFVDSDADDDLVDADSDAIDEDGTYTSKEEVALYLHTYGHLPSNYITKDEAEDAGWKTEGLSLAQACPGMSIGGDRFGNREGKLPKASGRTWRECDIDYAGERSRNAKRIVYSNDGLIYYTEDHYQTFERLY